MSQFMNLRTEQREQASSARAPSSTVPRKAPQSALLLPEPGQQPLPLVGVHLAGSGGGAVVEMINLDLLYLTVHMEGF